MKFDDVNLNDTPKLDIDFGGLDGKDDKKAGGGGGFSFGGGWGGGWGSGGGNTSSSWGFGGAEDKKDDALGGDTGGWGFTSTAASKKDKKKSTGFDFGLDDGLAGDDGFGASKEADKPVEEDPWGSFGGGKKAGKKGKKGAAMSFEPEPIVEVPPPPPAAPEPKADEDPWGGE